MKKLLSIVMCVLFGVTSLLAAEVYTSIQVVPSDGGVASVTGVDYNQDESTKTRGGWSLLGGTWYYYTGYIRNTTNGGTITSPSTETVTSWSENGSWNIDKNKTKFYQNAEADVKVVSVSAGYAFDKWTCNSSTFTSATFSNHEALETTVDYGTQSRTQGGNATITANFKKIITPRQSVIDWTKPAGESATYTTTVDLFKTTYFKVSSITHNRGEATRTFSCTPAVDAEIQNPGNSIELTLTAGTDVQDGDQFIITLQADNGASETITVNIKSKITVKFIHPKVGKGSFKAVRTNSDNGESCNISHESEDITEEFTKGQDFFHTFTATPAEGYRFYRWMINGSESSVLTTASGGYTLKDGDEITVEFLPTNMAMFTVKDGDGTQYFKLDDAIAAAQNSSSKTVVVAQNGTLYTEYKTPTNEYASEHGAKYEFTIPAGITLLVPGDAKNTVTKSLKNNEDIIGAHTSASQYRLLTLSSNTRIIAKGDICVFSKLTYRQPYNGMPNTYGEISMGSDTEVILKNGSQLTCFGYISGNPANSFVKAENGATVYEAFQIRGWRGGTIGSGMNENQYQVFPVWQYYVQNVETKLILEYGAVEYASTCVAMLSDYLKFPMNAPFITQSKGGTNDEGFLCLSDGAQVEKWYDYTTDRQVYLLKGTKADSRANIGNIVLDVSVKVESKKYVLPINNNIDLTLDNIKLTSLYDLALLADATLEIKSNAEIIVNGELFVYDKEVHTTDFHYPLGEYIYPVAYTAHHKKSPGLRKWTNEDVGDAKIIVDGKLLVQDSGNDLHGIGLYTTGSSGSDLSYGADIISNGGGLVSFGVIEPDENTYYYKQNDDDVKAEDYIAIPVTNARLRNGDGTWSAGSEAKADEEYIYSTNRKKWVTPKEGVSFSVIANNAFSITLPNQGDPTQNVELGVTTDDVMRIEDFVITWPDNTYFIKGGDATYDPTNKKIIMPITYKVQKTHNYGRTPNEYVGELVVSCTYSTEDGVDHTETATIDLSAVENYTPDFTVKIEEKDVTSNGTYDFEETVFGQPSKASLTITPAANNVAGLGGVEWSVVPNPNPPFSVNESKILYSPTPTAANTGTLTIQATYTDEAGNRIKSKEVSVTLNGTARKKASSLEFKEDLDGTTIYQADFIEDIFKDTGNGANIEFTYKYENGEVASDLVVIEKDGENYKLQAKITDYVEDRTLIITAKQNDNELQFGATKSIKITIKPLVTWNWSNLHFGKSYTNSPVTLAHEGEWSLSLTNIPQVNGEALVSLSGSAPDYIATVGTGEMNQVYLAEFTFTLNDVSKSFTSKIFADPRMLGFCVDYNYQFEGVSTKSTVTFTEKDGENLAATTFKPGDIWEINMTGIPKTLHFNASGNNDWYVAERPNTSTSYRPIINWTKLTGEQAIQLQPTTNQIMIQYGSGDNASIGTIAGLCIDELELSSNQDVVYFPIYKNGEETTTKEVIITHTSQQIELEIDENIGFTISSSDPTEISTGDDEKYYQTIVTIQDGGAEDVKRVAKGEYTLIAKQSGVEYEITIHADEVPQGLPIRLAEDDVKRYHFIIDKSNYVSWDATNRLVVFQNPGNDVTRTATFRFEGAPARLSFNSLQTSGWQIYESATGAVNDFKQCLDYSVDGTNVTYQLHYTTRYVRLDYYSDDRREITLSNLTIEGDPMLLVNPDELEFSDEEGMKSKELTLTTINLKKIKVVLDNEIDFKITHAKAQTESNEYLLTADQYSDALGINKVGDIVIKADWVSTSLANDGVITIYNVLEDNSEVVLTKVKLVAAGKYIRLDNANKTGIYTGIPDGTRDLNGDDIPDAEYKYTYHGKDYNENNASPYAYHEVNLTNAFAPDGTALFDYMFVYGETTTKEGQGTNITAPNSDTESGSNARTPLLVYARDVDANGIFDRYRHIKTIDDINVGTKPHIEGVTISGNEVSEDENKEQIEVPVNYIPVPEEGQLSVYITGFAPYATTGYTKGDEGVFFFRGHAGSKLHVYLEDAHIFARNKMESGQPFYSRGDKRNPTFSEKYARGSGGVLVFECVTETEQIDYATPFEVSIHTIGNNLLKSNYGCFNYFFGMDPFQISAPVHVRLHSANHVRMSKTTLNFDDIWPTKLDEIGQITESKRTNGFLGLKKLNNNAPSIDLGNPYTTVNFNGGQVQLQNAQIVSTNYKTTLAISYRSGEYGGDKVGLKFAYGIGTDSVGGTVNFYDGTITIEPMWVKEEYKNYYFIDKDKNGDEIKKQVGTITNGDKTLPIYEYQTTCLRCPKNTNVYGGSICWLRACQHVTSKGGAPSGGGGIDVGQYIYTFNSETDEKDENTQLIKSIQFPDGITTASGDKLEDYLVMYYPNDQYGMNSITPDADGRLYFWIPEGYGGVSAEKDKFLTTWKACMTEISAGMQGLTGTVGGNTAVEKNEEIKYMLYCQIDQNISNVITAGTGDGDDRKYSYSAPVKVPAVAQSFYNGAQYTSIPPTSVGEELQNEVISEHPYEVTDKVYYITTATADVWQTFTAPFDVAKIWVVETYSEAELERLGKAAAQEGKIPRDSVMLAQAKHNADFAAFFGVAMAIGTSNPLETIFNDFKEWGMIQDSKTTDDKGNPITPLYAGTSAYTLRDRYQLIPYNGSNWNKANFYLNHNAADWEIDEEGEREFNVHWELPDVSDDGVPEGGILMRKGETYSMLFPYCTGCFDENFERDFWDYWSGKFLIFESVDYSKESDKVHIIEGSDYIKEDWTAEELETLKPEGIFTSDLPEEGTIKVTGNSTFSFMETFKEDVYIYSPDPMGEWFKVNQIFDDKTNEYVPVTTATKILPTESFLWANISTYKGMPARGVKRTGEIIYPDVLDDDDNNGNQNGTSGHMPTVGGGNDLFITSIAGGINVAVAAPQNVRVLSSTGAVIYSGYITTAVDIQLPTTGIYIVSGENEVQKILF